MDSYFGPFLDDDQLATVLHYEHNEQQQILNDETIARLIHIQEQTREFEEFDVFFTGYEYEVQPHRSEPPIELNPQSTSGIDGDCTICTEPLRDREFFTTGACSHTFCSECVRKYLMVVARETKKYPIACLSCQEAMDTQKCLALLTGKDHEDFQSFIMEKENFHNLKYCANPSCASPFDMEHNPNMEGSAEEFKVLCLLCYMETCVKCKTLWHTGVTCAEFSEQKEQTALARLAKEKGWQKCPKCESLIEKNLGDCNFVSCTCGCSFCHKCGKEYRDTQSTENNLHGTAACECGLFGGQYVAPTVRELNQSSSEIAGTSASSSKPKSSRVWRLFRSKKR